MKFLLLVLLLPYLVGSIPFGLIFARISGYGDIRKIGSGNIGATNVLRTGNKKLALATLLLDGLKGYLAAVIPFYWYHRDPSALHTAVLVAGFAAVLGHILPVWLKFKGGKGVATAIGAILAARPLLAGIIALLWLAIFMASRISSLSALAAFAGATLLSLMPLPQAFISDYPFGLRVFMALLSAVIFFTHRTNIARIIKGEEHTRSKK